MKRLLAFLMCMMMTVGFAAAEEAEDPWPFYVFHGDESVKRIAITVDDCYEIEYVRQILELCLEYDIRVTFFPLGAMLREEDAPLWRDVVDFGCEIGSHNYQHLSLTNMENYNIVSHQRRFKAALNNVLGYEYHVRWMRPPFGSIYKVEGDRTRIRYALQSEGIEHAILWNVSQTDPNLAIKDVKNGAILLYHARRKDYLCLKQLIPEIQAQGYEMVTISELLNLPDPLAEPADEAENAPEELAETGMDLPGLPSEGEAPSATDAPTGLGGLTLVINH